MSRSRRRAAALAVVAALAAGCGDGARVEDQESPLRSPPRPTSTARDTVAAAFHGAGVALRVPSDWEQRDGPVVATEFAGGAACRSVLTVDFEPPADPVTYSGAGEEGAANTLRSVVQVCARPVDDRQIDAFLRDTYGDVARFEPIRLGGRDAYRDGDASESLIFTQTVACRFQIATAVTADETLRRRRTDEVRSVLDSLVFQDPKGHCG